MPNKKNSHLKVGVFVFIAAAIVILTIFWAKDITVTAKKRDLSVYFKSISGLNVGDPVNVNGVKKGDVRNIELVGDSVKVDFILDKSVVLKNDYEIQVAMLELMGGKQLYVNPGKSNFEIDYSLPLIGTQEAGFTEVLKSVTGMTDDIKKLISGFQKATDNLNTAIVSVNEIITDPAMRRDLKGTLSNLESTSNNLNSLVIDSRGSLRNISSKINNSIDNIDNTISNGSSELNRTFQDFRSLSNKIDTLVGNINLIVQDVQQQKTGISKFIYDDKFYNNLNKTLNEIESLSRKIRKDGIKLNLF